MKQSQLQQRIERLSQASSLQAIRDIKHGIERETLRINQDATVSQRKHPKALGSALKNSFITTDYSESLLEFITPPIASIEETLARLQDVHKFTQANIGSELLWPNSMPCFIGDETDIPLADYGMSNIGKMKTLYRNGLKHRYGSMMQVIAGVHYNFSLPQEFWQVLSPEESLSQQTISQYYFDLIRNYQRMSWLIPYLFGASPAICQSFLKHDDSHDDFSRAGKGTRYLPYATSLRMSDLGYTNDAQSALEICYNSPNTYIDSVRKAIHTNAPSYQKFNVAAGQDKKQLNDNVLQIENELYSSIRPKQPTEYLEKPTDALSSRGVSYIEVRALDLQPDVTVGITPSQCYFLDAFLVYCALLDSPAFTASEYADVEHNMNAVVSAGRKPGLNLTRDGQAVGLKQWAEEIIVEVHGIAAAMDKAHGNSKHTDAVDLQKQKVANPELTPSAQLLKHIVSNDLDIGQIAMMQAQQHCDVLKNADFIHYSESFFTQEASRSMLEQAAVEASDSDDFDTFLANYFEV